MKAYSVLFILLCLAIAVLSAFIYDDKAAWEPRIEAAYEEGRGRPKSFGNLEPGNYETEVVVREGWNLAIVVKYGPSPIEASWIYVASVPKAYLTPGAKFVVQ